LGTGHDRVAFDCGSAELNAFFKATARQHAAKGISRTSVLADLNDPAVVLGFYTLVLCEIHAEHLPVKHAKKYPKHPLPAVRLARLAVSKRHRGKGYGEVLLMEAIHRTVLISAQAGGIGLFVDAKDSAARSFYEHYGFLVQPGNTSHLFLPMETLHSVIVDAAENH
jgi:GNAT superfamily N-acetyltransferase